MQSGDELQGIYALEEFIGQGGQGECWLVREGSQRWLGKLYRLHHKSIEPYEIVEREANILRQLAHPNIPAHHDTFIETGTSNLWSLREWIEGEPLAEHAKNHRYDESEVRMIASQVLEILTYIHSLSPAVIHRDIKPSNIIVRPDKSLALIDFGAVRDAVYSQEGASVVGTFGYTPPEQFLGHPTPASDLYALGATLVYLLSRQDPATLPLSRNRLQFESYINVQPRFMRILQQLLTPIAEERFQKAQEVLEAIERCKTTSLTVSTSSTILDETVKRAATLSLKEATENQLSSQKWQRNRTGASHWWWEGHDTNPLKKPNQFPELKQVIQKLREQHQIQSLDALSDPLELVTAIDERFGVEDETGRQYLVRLLHPHDALDILLGYYEPSFLLPMYAQTWVERLSLLSTHSSDNPIGQWGLLYFLQKHHWLPQAAWYGDDYTLRLQIDEESLIGLPRRMSRFLRTFGQLPIGKQAKQYDALCKHWEQISLHFHLCCALRPAHLTILLQQGNKLFEKTYLPTYPQEIQKQWHKDRLLRWSLRYLTAWPPNWFRIGRFLQKDHEKCRKLGGYIASVFEAYASIDRLRHQLQEEYSWLLPATGS